MNHQQTIEQALTEISIAEALVDQAKQKYYSARKKLEGLYSPASPKRVNALDPKLKAKLLAGRERTIQKKSTPKKHSV